ncbi:MerR family transcriptional regulator [Kitasatospora sp. NPDC048365]|uniref:MerR family transcriptional regulator n=1 Tax=Kitasatospora sp. NPDC048365 TaxID=3364050 RepID=UPI0037151C43
MAGLATSGTPAHSAPVVDEQRDGACVTTGDVARRFGVSPTTVRSWERRYGIGPAHHETGRHRRWSPQDIAVVEVMCNLTARGVAPGEAARLALRPGADPAGSGDAAPASARRAAAPGGSSALPVGPVRPECRGLARAAVRLDSAEVSRILRSVIAELGTVEAWSEVMAPALRAAGRKWAAEGERYVEVEHLLSWHVSTALRVVADRNSDTRPGPFALLAGAPRELHTLPLDALVAGLAERGLPSRMLGPAVPAPALLEAVRRTGPAAVALWSQSSQTVDYALARQTMEAAWGGRGSRSHPFVLIAGPGWASVPPEGLIRPNDLRGALDHIERLLTAGQGHRAVVGDLGAPPAGRAGPGCSGGGR